MQLSLERPGAHAFIRWCETDRIMVVDTELRGSFIVSRDVLIDAWPPVSVATLTVADCQPILDLKPELVLLGSGPRLVFPSQAILAEFLTRRIGIEVMDNSAAARTFNVLIGEGRNAVAGFLLPG